MQAAFSGISIIITSYNYGRYLSRAIDSARAQDVPNLEIVVVDNASTDESWEIAQAAGACDPRVRPYRNDANIGMVPNHIRGAELATQPKILFLSADDYLLPGHVARLLAVHREHPEIDYIFTGYFHVDENDRPLGYMKHVGHPYGSYFGGRNEFADLLTYDNYTCMSTTIFDRAEFLEHPFDPQIIAGDYDRYLTLAESGAVFAFLDVAGVAFRIHSAEYSGKNRYMATGKQLLDHLCILEKHLTQANGDKIAGREQGIANLVLAKVQNLAQFPEIAAPVMAQAQPRIDAVIAFLNESRGRFLAAPKTSDPRISIVLAQSDDLGALLTTVESIHAQTYANKEVVFVTNGSNNAAPFVLDRLRDVPVRVVYHSGSSSRGTSLNDALMLCGGEIVAYADPGVAWHPGHLQRLAQDFHTQPIDGLIVRADYVLYGSESLTADDVEIARIDSFVGSNTANEAVLVGEGIPLSAFAHRRALIDRIGRFNGTLAYLTDFDFVSRVFQTAPIGFDETLTVTLRQSANSVPAALRDPSGYLDELQALYERHPVDAEIAQRRERHVARMRDAFASPRSNGADLARFAAISRGA